ncbi:MAG: flavin-containing monooxygenase [Kofleriaceae bacterium]
MTTPEHLDIIIVGAGLSGIGAAYHVQAKCPKKSYAVLEGRERLGGTWDLFKYPGIRSDSDMYTLGYRFRPWSSPKAIADGPSILSYVRETAEAYGIDKKIRYGHRVEHATWSSKDHRWTLRIAGERTLTCSFLYLCVGYYDYAKGYTPELEGREQFRGQIVHPQFWPDDLDYANKRVVVIGSGATAVTLVPELARKAAHVTMLQRSPTYVVTVPGKDPIAEMMRGKVPPRAAYGITRWKNVLFGMAFFAFSRRFPKRAKRFLINQVKKSLGPSFDATHFTPNYSPWDQRLCLVPDDDLFAAIREGSASVVTDHIASFTPTGIALRSGAHLDADIVVTATGLVLQIFGGMSLDVDGKRIVPSEVLVYKGMMCSDVPNLAFASGYTNASWTLKADLTSEYVCRLINFMDKRHHTSCRPRRPANMKELPILDFSSGYVTRALDYLPRQGTERPWRLYQNYALDLVTLRYLGLDDPSMEFV